MNFDPSALKSYVENNCSNVKSSGGSYVFTCPRCNKDKKLWIRKRDGAFCCWVCRNVSDFHGRPEFALSEILGIPINEIQASLYGEVIEGAEKQYIEVKIQEDLIENDINFKPVYWPLDYYSIFDKVSHKGLSYLHSRGLTDEVIKEYGIKFSPQKQRVMFPVSFDNELYGWQGRLIIPDKYIDNEGNPVSIPKILSSKELSGQRDRIVMFADRLMKSDHAILTEGPFDALKCHYAGGNICCMGKVVAKGQLDFIINMGITKLYLALDPDAFVELNKIVEDLYGDIELYDMVPKDGRDLGEMSLSEAYALFKSAKRINPGYLYSFID